MNGTHQDTHQDTSRYIKIHQDTYRIGNYTKSYRKLHVTRCWRCRDRPRHGRGRRRAISAADGRTRARGAIRVGVRPRVCAHVTCLTRAPPRARSAGRLYCTVFLVCFCSQGENTVFFVFLNPNFVVLPPRARTQKIDPFFKYPQNPTSKQTKPRGCKTPRCRQTRTRGNGSGP